MEEEVELALDVGSGEGRWVEEACELGSTIFEGLKAKLGLTLAALELVGERTSKATTSVPRASSPGKEGSSCLSLFSSDALRTSTKLTPMNSLCF